MCLCKWSLRRSAETWVLCNGIGLSVIPQHETLRQVVSMGYTENSRLSWAVKFLEELKKKNNQGKNRDVGSRWNKCNFLWAWNQKLLIVLFCLFNVSVRAVLQSYRELLVLDNRNTCHWCHTSCQVRVTCRWLTGLNTKNLVGGGSAEKMAQDLHLEDWSWVPSSQVRHLTNVHNPSLRDSLASAAPAHTLHTSTQTHTHACR